MDATGWTAVGAVATGLGSGVGALSLIVIGFQTWQTRRAAEATRDAARATENQVAIAAQALDAAKQANTQARFLAVEEIRSRIDSQLPRILVTQRGVEWPPLLPSNYLDGAPSPYPASEILRLPQDGSTRLLVRVNVSIANESDFGVALTSSDTLFESGNIEKAVPLPHEFSLGANERRENLHFYVERTVDQWIEPDVGSGASPYQFEVWHASRLDTGAVLRYRIDVGGSILEPVPEQDAAWRLSGQSFGFHGGSTPLVARDQPVLTIYYLSRSRGIELPDVTELA